MPDDEKWFRFETPEKRTIRVPILSEITEELNRRAYAQGVSLETLVNVLLIKRIQKSIFQNKIGGDIEKTISSKIKEPVTQK